MNTRLLFAICAVLGLSPVVQGQGTDSSSAVVVTVPDNILFKSGGSLYHYQSGQARRIDQDLRISDRVTVRANGSVLKDGNVFTVGDGQMVYPDGRLENTPVGFAPGVGGAQ